MGVGRGLTLAPGAGHAVRDDQLAVLGGLWSCCLCTPQLESLSAPKSRRALSGCGRGVSLQSSGTSLSGHQNTCAFAPCSDFEAVLGAHRKCTPEA